MRAHRFLSTLTLLAALAPYVLSGPASASLLAYEGFGYAPPGALLNTQNGGTGWNGAWGTGNPLALIATPGLTFGSLAETPGAATATAKLPQPPGGADITFEGRRLPTSVPVAGDNTTLYLSFLLRPEAGFGFYGGLNLGDLFIGKSGPVPTYSLESGGGNIETDPSAVAQEGQTVLLVLRAQFLAGNDQFDLFINPVPGGAEPSLPDATMTNYDLPVDLLGTLVTINNAGAWTVDEIRLGETFADVTPAAVPAPPAALLVAGGLMLAGLARRRGRRA